jgi:hypothetical protein
VQDPEFKPSTVKKQKNKQTKKMIWRLLWKEKERKNKMEYSEINRLCRYAGISRRKVYVENERCRELNLKH